MSKPLDGGIEIVLLRLCKSHISKDCILKQVYLQNVCMAINYACINKCIFLENIWKFGSAMVLLLVLFEGKLHSHIYIVCTGFVDVV